MSACQEKVLDVCREPLPTLLVLCTVLGMRMIESSPSSELWGGEIAKDTFQELWTRADPQGEPRSPAAICSSRQPLPEVSLYTSNSPLVS